MNVEQKDEKRSHVAGLGHPILYSFCRCPYAMRARMGLASAGVRLEIREVDLKNKPQELLSASPKGTVPVLCVPGDKIIDESLDILIWALDRSDPLEWKSGLSRDAFEEMLVLIQTNDVQFVPSLRKYKYADRYPEHPQEHYRDEGLHFLDELERRLTKNKYLFRETLSFGDVAIFPFVRQFFMVDDAWSEASPYPHVKAWLKFFAEHLLFKTVMQKYPVWHPKQQPGPFYFPA